MGIFDLFKKLVKKNKVEEIVIVKLGFSDIEDWINNQIKENESKQSEIISQIKDKIKLQNNEINEKIKILEDFDVESKKEKEHIKEIVNDSRKSYIMSVENFLENLNNLEINEFESLMKKINKIFLNFNKSSYKNYERATILIGKEMANIKEGIKVFSKEILKIYEENKEIVDFFKTIQKIKSQYQNINSIESNLNIIIEKKESLNKKISEGDEENILLKQSVEEIKKSQNYLDFLNSQKMGESLKSELKKSIFELKYIIDFKALANFFHIFEKQMIIVKKHREDFYTTFLEDNGKLIVNLLDESKLNNSKIIENINEINLKLEKTKNHKQEMKKDETQELYFKIKEIALELDNLKIENAKEKKREEKLKINKEELINELKQELGEMNVEIV